MRTTWTLALVLAGAAPAAAADWYAKAVKGVSASFAPAEAKPGQTVTLTVTVELTDGYFTYPLAQPEKAAANYVNKLTFPEPGAVVFVGTAADAAGLPTKAEPGENITAMRYCPGVVTYTRKAVVSPKAAAGPAAVAATVRLNVCDASNCFPPKAVAAEATLKVLDGPPVPVAAEYAAEVERAAGGK